VQQHPLPRRSGAAGRRGDSAHPQPRRRSCPHQAGQSVPPPEAVAGSTVWSGGGSPSRRAGASAMPASARQATTSTRIAARVIAHLARRIARRSVLAIVQPLGQRLPCSMGVDRCPARRTAWSAPPAWDGSRRRGRGGCRSPAGDLQTRYSPGDAEAVVRDLLGDVQAGGRGVDGRELVTELLVDGLEPVGQLDQAAPSASKTATPS